MCAYGRDPPDHTQRESSIPIHDNKAPPERRAGPSTGRPLPATLDLPALCVRLRTSLSAPHRRHIMRLGITVDMSGPHPKLDIDRVLEAERLGFSQAWTGEAYGTDAVTPATWMLARTTKLMVGTGIMQIPARTPACAAMTAMTLQHMSGGRFLCGLGVSGPQVVEGWHGTRFGKPMTRTKEYIAIIRQILERKGNLTFKGEEYEIPYAGPDATGLGKPLRSI